MRRTIATKMRAAGMEVPRTPPSIALLKMRERTERERRAAAADPAQIPLLLRKYFNFPSMGFHDDLLVRMFHGDPETGQRKLCVNWPTDFAKSLTTTFFFPLLSLMNDPDEAHGICGVNINDSKRRLQVIQREIETNERLVNDYPWIAKPAEKNQRLWSATQMNVVGRSTNKPNPSVLATAIGSNDIKGRRMKLMIDDAEGEDHRHSPWKREQLYDFIKLDAIRCFEDKHESSRPLLANIGTPWDPDSIHFRLEHEGWSVVRMPCFEEDGRTCRWPAKKDKVNEFRYGRKLPDGTRTPPTLNRLQFAIAFLMDPTGGDPTKMSYQQIAELATKPGFEMPNTAITLVSLDPASGSANRRADYAGITVTKVVWNWDEELPLIDILEAHKFTGGLYEQVHLCASLASQYDCPVIYETNSQQGNNYGEVFQKTHPETKLLRHLTTTKNKWDEKLGLTVIKTLLRAERLRVPKVMLEHDEGLKALLTEIRDLGGSNTSHDHLCASVWFTFLHAHQQAKRYNGPQIISGYRPRMFGGQVLGGYRTWR